MWGGGHLVKCGHAWCELGSGLGLLPITTSKSVRASYLCDGSLTHFACTFFVCFSGEICWTVIIYIGWQWRKFVSINQSINQSFVYWHMTKRICWHLIQNCNTRKVNRNLHTARGLRSFYRSSVLCDRAFVCHVDDAAGCTAVSPSPGAGAVRAGRGLNRCYSSYLCPWYSATFL